MWIRTALLSAVVAAAAWGQDAKPTADDLKKKDEDAKEKIAEYKKAMSKAKADGDIVANIKTLGETQHPKILAELKPWLTKQLPALEASGEKLWSGRTVVLIDDTSGGPAEVFAAALHDRADATTVGEATAGMAIVQRLVPTESGGSLFMTVARYLSPKGTPLGGRGLQPDDRVVSFPGDAEGEGRDAILERGLELARDPRAPRRIACLAPTGARRPLVVV